MSTTNQTPHEYLNHLKTYLADKEVLLADDLKVIKDKIEEYFVKEKGYFEHVFVNVNFPVTLVTGYEEVDTGIYKGNLVPNTPITYLGTGIETGAMSVFPSGCPTGITTTFIYHT